VDENAPTLPPKAQTEPARHSVTLSFDMQPRDKVERKPHRQRSTAPLVSGAKSDIVALTPSMMAEPAKNDAPTHAMPPPLTSHRTQLGIPAPAVFPAMIGDHSDNLDSGEVETNLDIVSIAPLDNPPLSDGDERDSETDVALEEIEGLLEETSNDETTAVKARAQQEQIGQNVSNDATKKVDPKFETVVMNPPQTATASGPGGAALEDTIIGTEASTKALAATVVMGTSEVVPVTRPHRKSRIPLILFLVAALILGVVATAAVIRYPFITKVVSDRVTATIKVISDKVTALIAPDATVAAPPTATVAQPTVTATNPPSVSQVNALPETALVPAPSAPNVVESESTSTATAGVLKANPPKEDLSPPPQKADTVLIKTDPKEDVSPPSQEADTVLITLTGLPKDAQILVNNRASQRQFEVPRSDKAVKVEVRHPDFAKTVKRVVPGKDKVIHIRMKKDK
jgi:hypothetical protein